MNYTPNADDLVQVGAPVQLHFVALKPLIRKTLKPFFNLNDILFNVITNSTANKPFRRKEDISFNVTNKRTDNRTYNIEGTTCNVQNANILLTCTEIIPLSINTLLLVCILSKRKLRRQKCNEFFG